MWLLAGPGAGVASSSVVMPPEAATAEGGSYSGILAVRLRLQDVYDGSLFTNGPVRIKALRFRRDHTVASYPAADVDVRLTLSTTSKSPGALSTTFSENLGVDAKTVFQGALHLSSTNAVPTGGPAPFDVEIPLAATFDYDPAAGNLLLEIRTFTGAPNFWLDGVNSATDKASRCFGGNPDAGTADLVDSSVDPVEFVVDVLAPPSVEQVVLPPSALTSAGNDYSGLLTGDIRIQDIYDRSMFPSQPIRIKALRFRRHNSVGPVAPAPMDVEVALSASSKEADALSLTMDENLGSNNTVVFSGWLAISSTNAGTVGSTKPFDIEIPCTTPFVYDPAAGNLLVEIRTATGIAGLWTDAVSDPNDKASRQWAGSRTSTVAGIATTTADVLQVVYELVAPTRTAVLPPGMAAAAGNQPSTLFQGGWRAQMAYDKSLLPETPVRISALRFRRSPNTATISEGSIALKVSACATPRAPDTLSEVLDENLGVNATVVFDGDLVLSSTNNAAAGLPNPFDLEIPFSTPFLYNPAEGHLLFEVRTFTGIPGIITDNVLDPDDKAQWVFTPSPNGAVAPAVNSAVEVVQIVYEQVLVPSTAVLPPGMATVAGDQPSTLLQGGWRAQMAYDKSLLPETPVQISALRFRRAPNTATILPTSLNLRLSACTTPRAPDTLSGVLDENLGGDNVVVFEGDLVLASTNNAASGMPNPFDLQIPFSTPFVYYPAQGHLLFEIRTYTGVPGLVIDDVLNSDDKAQRIIVPDPNGTVAPIVNSSAEIIQIVYTALAIPPAPAILVEPVSLSVVEGQPAAFSVAASGADPLSYQWYFKDSVLAGAQANGLSIAAASSADAGTYHVVVTNISGSVTSAPATLVVRLLPRISRQPVGGRISMGSPVQLSVGSTGFGPLHYQWYRDGGLMSDATAPILFLNNVQPGDAGSYTVRVWNDDGFVFSEPAVVAVVSGEIAAAFVAEGLQLSVDGLAGASYAVEWSDDLVTWNPLATIVNANASWQLTDPTSGDARVRFYRLRKL